MARACVLVRTAVTVFAMQLVSYVMAAESQVRWFNDVNEAWRATRIQGRPMLVFVTRQDCLPCARMKVKTYADQKVATAINDRFVALTIDASQSSPLLKDLAVNAFPATFVISPDAVILQRIDGYVSPEEMAAKLVQLAPVAREAMPAAAAVGRVF